MRRRSTVRSIAFASALVAVAACAGCRTRRPRATTGRASAGTRPGRARRPFSTGHHRGEPQVAAPAAGAARRHRRLVADLPARASRSAARRTTSSSSRRRTARPTRSTRRAASCSGSSRRPATRRGRARRRSRPRRPSPTRAGNRSTPRRPAGRSTSSRLRTATARGASSITKLPSREKIAASLNFANGHVIATTGGYIGDAPPVPGACRDHQHRRGRCCMSGTRSARTGAG